MLVQKVFGPDQKSHLLDLVGPEAETIVYSFPFHLVVYVQGEAPLAIIHLAAEEDRRIEFEQYPLFSQFLNRDTVWNFNEALFWTTLFTIDPTSLLKFETSSFQRAIQHPLIRDYLSPTHGHIVYAHQLELLYGMLSGEPYSASISFRKDWNLKRPSSRKKAAELWLTRDYNLLDLLRESTWDEHQFVYSANFSGAYQLSKYLSTQQ